MKQIIKKKVPVKILNPTADSVHINKGAYLATFKLCDNYTDIFCHYRG